MPTLFETQHLAFINRILKLVGIAPSVKQAICEALSAVGNCLGVSRAYIYLNDASGYAAQLAYEWTKEDLKPRIMAFNTFSYITDLPFNPSQLVEQGMFYSEGQQIPQDIQENFDSEGITSMLVMPVMDDQGNMAGFMGVHECYQERLFAPDEIELLGRITGIIQDILFKPASIEGALQYSSQELAILLDNMEAYSYVSDIHTHELVYMSPSLRNALGIINPAGLCHELIYNAGHPCLDCPKTRIIKKDGARVAQSRQFYCEPLKKWLLSTDKPIQWSDGRILHMQTSVDVTLSQELTEKYRKLATIDPLTRLPNETQLLGDIERLAKDPMSEHGLVLINLDDFKLVNTLIGYGDSDRLLQEIGSYFTGAKIQGSLYRLQTDDFAILLKNTTHSQLTKILSLVLNRFKRSWKLQNGSYLLDTSLGAALTIPGRYDASTLLRHARIALLSAKEKGKNCSVFYDDTMDERFYLQSTMHENLSEAAAGNLQGFGIYYEPYIDLHISRYQGARVHPYWFDGGYQFDFQDVMATARIMGLGEKIFAHILVTAGEQCHRWNRLLQSNYSLIIPLPAYLLRLPSFFETLDTAIKRSKIPNYCIVFELTYDPYTDFSTALYLQLQQLKKLDIRICLKCSNWLDFDLHEIPFDLLQISGRLVDNLPRDPYSRQLLLAVADLVHSKAGHVCVHGITNLEQLRTASIHKIDYAMGSQLGAPMMPQDYTALLLSSQGMYLEDKEK
ncbi:MAG: sensor domain-containing diguanylate cyclase [Christensenellales bacterium]